MWQIHVHTGINALMTINCSTNIKYNLWSFITSPFGSSNYHLLLARLTYSIHTDHSMPLVSYFFSLNVLWRFSHVIVYQDMNILLFIFLLIDGKPSYFHFFLFNY